MNADEFITAVNRQAPDHLPRADREFLRRHQVILGSDPYYQKDIPKAIGLLGMTYEFLGKIKQQAKRSPIVTEVRPEVAISQVVVIHNLDAEQCHRIRDALIQAQLINFEGHVFVSFSPYTRRTIDSLSPNAFAEADYHMEYTVFEEAVSQDKTKPFAIAINPVVFIKDIEPTLVQLSFVLGGKRQPGISLGAPLPSPLYRAFLNINANSSQAIMDFMNAYKVYLFPMSWDSNDLSKYISGSKRVMRLILSATQNQLMEFWSSQQQKMRGILAAAAQGRLRQVVFPPIFPVCEDAIVEWHDISGYFAPDLAQTKVPRDVRHALFEFKEDKTTDAVRVRRYYGWLEYMWAELADDIYKGKAMLICERCGRIISPSTHGRQKRFCGLSENPECYKARKRKYVGISRKGLAQ